MLGLTLHDFGMYFGILVYAVLLYGVSSFKIPCTCILLLLLAKDMFEKVKLTGKVSIYMN